MGGWKLCQQRGFRSSWLCRPYNEYAYWKSIDAQTFTFDHISYGFDDEFLKDIYQDENNIIVEFFVTAKIVVHKQSVNHFVL